jgi:shikimate dehydrogenase
MTIYAEVIGDPIAQSKSPIIHAYWLAKLGMAGEYRRERVSPNRLGGYLRDRRADPLWRGCSVTIPHKEAVIGYLDELDPSAAAVGAVNCVAADPSGLIGYNTDVDGVAAALRDVPIQGSKVVIIGGGGAARAAISCLAEHGAGEIVVLVRDPARAKPLRPLFSSLQIALLGAARTLLPDSGTVINASSLGMTGCPAMPEDLLESLRSESAPTVFDMVYDPIDTAFLSAGGGKRVDGLAMLIGQAARAFELFFGVPAPEPDDRLRELLISGG